MSSRTVTIPIQVYTAVYTKSLDHTHTQCQAGHAWTSEAKLLTGKPAYPGLPCGKKVTVSFGDTLLSLVALRPSPSGPSVDFLTSKMALTSDPGVLTTALCPHVTMKYRLEGKKRKLPLS